MVCQDKTHRRCHAYRPGEDVQNFSHVVLNKATIALDALIIAGGIVSAEHTVDRDAAAESK